MKELIKTVVVIAAMCGMSYGMTLTVYPVLRVDMRTTAGAHIATGEELLGSADGATVTEWDTTQLPDGWTTLVSDGTSVDVLVLNASALVVGGRLLASEIWDDSRIVVVRDDVVVPSGVSLTLGAGTVVKFTEGAKIVVEDGGIVEADGAFLTDFSDDSVGGDTNFDGESVANGDSWWLEDEAVAALSTVSFVNGTLMLPRRTYTPGKAYGELPAPTKDGAKFGGWWTAKDGAGVHITADSIVASDATTLYAYWIAYALTIDPSLTNVVATASTGTITVAANDEWDVSCDADWVALEIDGDNVFYSVEENASTEARTATIRVSAINGMTRDFTINQSGMAVLGAPTINPADGTTFIGSSRRVSISGAEAGAEIRYTLDGSEPTATSKLYTKSFNVFDTTVVKAKAFKAGKLASATVSARIIRLQTLAEALDVPLWTVTTSGDAEWTVAEGEGRNGSSCARSGAIVTDENKYRQNSNLSTTVDGAGTLTFWWKVDCEDDDSEYNDWDYLKFEVDGAEIARIDGDSGWQQVSVKLKTDALHTLTWTYSKDDYDDEGMTGEDCGWVDQVAWTPSVGDSEVPVAWLENLGMVSAGATAVEAAGADPDGDGLTTAQEYIAGTDPTDPDSKFTASIEMLDGKPVVTYSPDLLSERKYIKFGKKSIGDQNEEWVEVKEGEEGDYNFFKISVELP